MTDERRCGFCARLERRDFYVHARLPDGRYACFVCLQLRVDRAAAVLGEPRSAEGEDAPDEE